MLKPVEASAQLRLVRELLIQGEPMPPTIRRWLVHAIDTRLSSPRRTIDQLLGLQSRSGGQLHAASRKPALHAAVKALADTLPGPTAQKAAALAVRIAKHRRQPDPELVHLERLHGRLPGTKRQLETILAGRTVALRLRNLNADDSSSATVVRHWLP